MVLKLLQVHAFSVRSALQNASSFQAFSSPSTHGEVEAPQGERMWGGVGESWGAGRAVTWPWSWRLMGRDRPPGAAKN